MRVYVLACCMQGLRCALLSRSNQKRTGVRAGISSVQSRCVSCIAELDGRRHLHPGVRSCIFGCPGVRSARCRRAEVGPEFIARPCARANALIRAHSRLRCSPQAHAAQCGCGLTPRSSRPATAGAVSPVPASRTIVGHRAYSTCLRGRLSSNVRPQSKAHARRLERVVRGSRKRVDLDG